MKIRMNTFLTPKSLFVLLAAGCCLTSQATSFSLGSQTTIPGKKYIGFFSGGSTISVTVTGQITMISGWISRPDGSLGAPMTTPGAEYASIGALNYPTSFGGDGVNHYPGGGANYDVFMGGTAGFGSVGAQTTDTFDPGTVRFGTVMGTLKSSPTAADWFVVGFSKNITFPTNGAPLYLAVHDTTYGNNSGSYSGKVTFVDPPLLSIQAYAGITIEGEAGKNYRIEYSPSVPPFNWNTLTNIVLPSSPYLFFDPTGPASGTRYYRAVKTN